MPFDQPDISTPIEGVEPQEMDNYASDPDVVKQIKADILPMLDKARDNRNGKIADDWERYRDVYNLRRTITFYDGRSKLFLGAIRDAVDTLTRIAKDSILADPYLMVESDVPRWSEVGVHFIKYLLEDQAKIRPKLSMFLRQLYQIGTSCMKFGWKTSIRNVKYRSRGEIGLEIKTRKLYDHYGPTLEVIDMQRVFAWPETATDYSGLNLVFEDNITTIKEIRQKVKDGWYDPDAAQKVIEAAEKSLAEDRKSRNQSLKEGITETTIDKDQLDITEVWVKFNLPDSNSEDDDLPWVWMTIAGDEVLRVQENPFWFQTPPYLFGAIFREHDYFYGHGVIEASEMWQYMLNDLVNQTMDCGTFSLNPIALMNPMEIDDPDMYQVEPGAKWLINPEAVEFMRPPTGMAQEGLGMVRFLMNVIQESSKATALVQGAPREGMGPAASTATGVSQLAASANAAIVDQVEELESQVFNPLAKMTEISAHQFMDSEMVIRIEGPDAVVMTDRIIEPQDLVMSTDIRWLASRRLREKLARGQQYLNLLNMALGVDPQITRAQGFEIDLKHIIKKAAMAIGADESEKIVRDITQSMPGVPAEMEYELVIAGRMVTASPFEPPEVHMAKIQALMAFPMPGSDFAKLKLQDLIMSHYQMAAQAQQQALAAQQESAGGPTGGPTTTPGATIYGPPIRPQEQPTTATEGAAGQGLFSQIGGSTGQAGEQ